MNTSLVIENLKGLGYKGARLSDGHAVKPDYYLEYKTGEFKSQSVFLFNEIDNSDNFSKAIMDNQDYTIEDIEQLYSTIKAFVNPVPSSAFGRVDTPLHFD